MSAARPLLPTAPRPRPVRAPTRAPGRLAPAGPLSGIRPGRLGAAEWRRRALHMAPGLLPAVLWFVPHRVPLSPTLRLILLAVIGGLAAYVWREWRSIRRAGAAPTAGRAAAIFGYAGGVALTLFCFPDRPECGFAVLGALAFGDGAATLVGKLAAGTPLHAPLPWNGDKSWAGLTAFLLCGTAAAATLYRGETLNPEAVTPAATWPVAVAVALCGVVPAALWESARSRLNDNARVALAAAAGVLLAHAVRVG